MAIIKITVDCDLMEANAKEKLLQHLSTLEVPILKKLVELQKSATAISYLKNNWLLVKGFLKV